MNIRINWRGPSTQIAEPYPLLSDSESRMRLEILYSWQVLRRCWCCWYRAHIWRTRGLASCHQGWRSGQETHKVLFGGKGIRTYFVLPAGNNTIKSIGSFWVFVQLWSANLGLLLSQHFKVVSWPLNLKAWGKSTKSFGCLYELFLFHISSINSKYFFLYSIKKEVDIWPNHFILPKRD